MSNERTMDITNDQDLFDMLTGKKPVCNHTVTDGKHQAKSLAVLMKELGYLFSNERRPYAIFMSNQNKMHLAYFLQEKHSLRIEIQGEKTLFGLSVLDGCNTEFGHWKIVDQFGEVMEEGNFFS